MSLEKTIVSISIDGSSIGNGTPNAKAGYGLVIEVNGSIAEYKSTLCPGCDRGLQTNNRAELRAALSALNFLHELAKLGYHKHCQLGKHGRSQQKYYSYISDGRPINDASDIVGIIRTDSTFVEKGATGVNRQMRHKDVWQTINNTMRCLGGAGMDVRFNHVRGHSGDWGNHRADELAGQMARAGYDYGQRGSQSEARCVSCTLGCDSLADLAVHYKDSHLGRDVVAESIGAAIANGDSSGRYECTLCERVLRSAYAMQQHMADKHIERKHLA